jgi:hypothetical protein
MKIKQTIPNNTPPELIGKSLYNFLGLEGPIYIIK